MAQTQLGQWMDVRGVHVSRSLPPPQMDECRNCQLRMPVGEPCTFCQQEVKIEPCSLCDEAEYQLCVERGTRCGGCRRRLCVTCSETETLDCHKCAKLLCHSCSFHCALCRHDGPHNVYCADCYFRSTVQLCRRHCYRRCDNHQMTRQANRCPWTGQSINPNTQICQVLDTPRK